MRSLHNDVKPIDEYLATVRARLRGCSADWQDEQIAELRSHIESLANDRVDIDPASNEALADALLRLGDPRTIGSELRREWLRDAGKWAIKNLLCWAGSLVWYSTLPTHAPMMVWAPVLEAVCPMIIVRALRQQKPPWLSEVSLLPYRVTKYRSYVQYVLLRASNTACCVSLAAQQFSHNLSVSQVCWLPVAIMFCVFPIQSTWKNNKIEGIRCLHAILVIDILLCGILVFSADLRIVIRCAIWLP